LAVSGQPIAASGQLSAVSFETGLVDYKKDSGALFLLTMSPPHLPVTGSIPLVLLPNIVFVFSVIKMPPKPKGFTPKEIRISPSNAARP
jgi:hypothetical protein